MNITEWTMIAVQILVLVTAISVDAFGAGFAYGVSRVRMPLLSVGIVSAASGLVLLLAMGAGRILGKGMPAGVTSEAGFIILFVLGVVKLFDRSGGKEAREANRDGDHILSSGEALTLGIALSLDSIAAGIGVGVDDFRMILAVPAALAINFLMMRLGGRVGKALAGRIHTDLGWISGVLLILLAFMRLL